MIGPDLPPDVRRTIAEVLDAQYNFAMLDGQGMLLAAIVDTTQGVLHEFVREGTIREAPMVEALLDPESDPRETLLIVRLRESQRDPLWVARASSSGPLYSGS